MTGSRVVSGRQAVSFASRVIAYLLGEEMSDTEVQNLTEQYASHFAEGDRSKAVLPERGQYANPPDGKGSEGDLPVREGRSGGE